MCFCGFVWLAYFGVSLLQVHPVLMVIGLVLLNGEGEYHFFVSFCFMSSEMRMIRNWF